MKDWIKENIVKKGVEDIRFYALMKPLHTFNALGLRLCYTSNEESTWVECKINEGRHKLESGYKITLQPLDRNYASEDFYQSDFESCIRSGYIVLKKSESDHIEKVRNIECIGGGLTLVTEAYVLVQ